MSGVPWKPGATVACVCTFVGDFTIWGRWPTLFYICLGWGSDNFQKTANACEICTFGQFVQQTQWFRKCV